jgi:BirA family biotin operon repressor/biotin-[acetyl-CoA-carboxylase] ligase
MLKKNFKNVKIKWPNDIFVNGKKISGILIESKIIGDERIYFCGMGINVNEIFGDDLKDVATSYFLEKKEKFDLNKILNEYLCIFFKNLRKYEKTNEVYYMKYLEYSCLLNKTVLFDNYDTIRSGKVVNILRNGEIQIDIDEKIEKFLAGEVKFLNCKF